MITGLDVLWMVPLQVGSFLVLVVSNFWGEKPQGNRNLPLAWVLNQSWALPQEVYSHDQRELRNLWLQVGRINGIHGGDRG
jgi:hypothetical protein